MCDNSDSEFAQRVFKGDDSDDGKSDKTIIAKTESNRSSMTGVQKSFYKKFADVTTAFVTGEISLFSKESKDKDPDSIKVNLVVAVDDIKCVNNFFSTKFDINENSTADDICLLLCQKIGIGPVARQLFALRIHGTNLYLSPSIKFKSENKENVYDFRIRFQMADVTKLQRLDIKATEYLFHQVRLDLIKGNIMDLDIEKYKSEILGLAVLDMYRAMVERGISKEEIMSDYIKYLPREIFFKHLFFIKKPISRSLDDVIKIKSSVLFVINEYLKAFWEMKSNYPTEIYKADYINGDESFLVTIKITPFYSEQAGIRISTDTKQKNFELLCSIEELCFISIGELNTVEISRKNGIPIYLKFDSKIALTSFISLLDGYYRMMVKWTFNLCKDLPTQSLLKLYESKCHGPIGGEYSYYKLDQKRNNLFGCFILRECDKKYNEFYIDVCTKNKNKPQSFKIEKLKNDEYIFNDDVTRYKSLSQLIRSYNDSTNLIYLKECLPPSEYDDSPLLLLCKEEKYERYKFTNTFELSDLKSFRTILINPRELQVYKRVGIEYSGKRNRTQTDRKCLKWNVSERKVKIGYNSVKFEKKFAWERFPDDSIKSARKFCRNPDGDLAGPWCYIRIENTNIIEKDYCDIDFCDKIECVIITYNQSLSFLSNHFTNIQNGTLFQFALKYWNSDAFVSNDQARFILSEYPLAIVEQDFIEIFISNNITGIRTKNESDYKSIKTRGLLSSYQFKKFFLSLDSNGFISLRVNNETNHPLLSINGSQPNEKMKYYSLIGQNFMWKMDSCEKKICEIHTTIDSNFNRFQILDKIVSKKNIVTYELRIFVRTTGSSQICLRSSPVLSHPNILIEFSNVMNSTRVSVQRFENGPIKLLGEKLMFGEFLLRYWEWYELHFMITDDTLTLFFKTDFGLVLLMTVKYFEILKMRWFSVGSFKSVSHWTFFCTPLDKNLLLKPKYPDCLLKSGDPYNGTQWVGEKGFPCVPWKHSNISKHIKELFSNEDDLSNSRNYCRNPGEQQDTNYCYYLHNNRLKKQNCSIRLCKQFGCKLAGTGNDYMGKINVSISGRICKHWTAEDPIIDIQLMKDKLFPDKSFKSTKNYCRNPSRKIAGVWCYVNDTKIFSDICNIEDCSISNKDLILLRGNDHNNYFFILPHWKVENRGFRFALKVWNPDFNNGFIVDFISFTNKSGIIRLIVGANKNRKIQLYYGDSRNQFEKKKELTQPHVLYSGKWTFFVLEIRNNELTLSRDFGGDTIFRWDGSRQNMFSPNLMNIMPPNNYTLGMHLSPLDDNFYLNCLLFSISNTKFGKLFAIKQNEIRVKARGDANLLISFSMSPDSFPIYVLHFNKNQSKIELFRHINENESYDLKSEIFQDIKVVYSSFWNDYKIKLTETTIKVFINQTEIFYFVNIYPFLIVVYWFSVGAENGSIFWTTNCPNEIITQINDAPINGEWTPWSDWYCSAICGGGFGYKIRNCTNPKPNINGRFCVGDSIQFGRCNEFKCGDISVNTINLIKKKFRTTNYHYVSNEGQVVILENDHEIINIISKESPNSYYVWIKNGHKIKSTNEMRLLNGNIIIPNSSIKHSGVYMCYFFRITNKRKYPFRILSFSVIPNATTFKLEFNEDLYIPSNSLTLTSIYTELAQKWIINNSIVYIDYGIAPLTEISFEKITVNGKNISGLWKCIVEEKSLGKKLDCYNGVISVYRSIWRVNEYKRIESALKVLNKNFFDQYLTEFLNIANQWVFLHTNSIVRLFGITLHNPTAMVMEYMKLGPLDKYLQENKSIMKQVDLVEAASNLASALYHLEENGIIHGKIRCRKLFVSSHTETSFSVRLADPGIAKPFTTDDIHWIPCENYSNLDAARKSKLADIWALSTTLWEIFMYGEQPKNLQNNRMFYLNGRRLNQPTKCPSNIYQIMFDCWNKDPDKRKKPQEILRDINRILYQAFNSRESHSYAKVALKNTAEEIESNLCMSPSTSTLIANFTDESNLELKTYNPFLLEKPECSNYFNSDNRQIENVENVSTTNYNLTTNDSYTVSNISLNLNKTRLSSSITSIDSMESVFEFDEHCNVILQGRIGQGFYGEVFKGTLEWIHEKRDSRKVAIKKLKTSDISLTSLKDFEREISIMKSLKHPNIVEILGIIQEPEISLIMEYLDHGSLQCYLKIHKESLSTPQLLKFSLDIAKGMQYLGEKHVVHRDLAARNILVMNESTVKISDFGLAQVLGSSSDYYILQTCRDLPIKWYALESLRDGKFSPRTDVWSYGVTLYEMFSYGEDPQIQLISNNVGPEQELLLKALEEGRRYPCPVNCPQGIYVRIIHPCWNADPHSRPLFKQLCNEIEGLLGNY